MHRHQGTFSISLDKATRLVKKPVQVIYGEFKALQPRILLLQMAAAFLPPSVGGRTRAFLMRLAGLQVGTQATILDIPQIIGNGDLRPRLIIENYSMINIGCHFDLNDRITIAPRVSIGHEVMILTTTHDVGGPAHRAGRATTKPVMIGEGAWVGARAVIFPGVTVGAGSIIAAGAIVTRDVPPNTLVAGVPARYVRHLGD